jgi:hypothetical protein
MAPQHDVDDAAAAMVEEGGQARFPLPFFWDA